MNGRKALLSLRSMTAAPARRDALFAGLAGVMALDKTAEAFAAIGPVVMVADII
jgi:hypothetical protein